MKQKPGGAMMTAESKVSPNCPFKDLQDQDEEWSCEKCLTRPCEEDAEDEETGEFYIGFCPGCGWMGEYENANVDKEKIMMEIKRGVRAEPDDTEAKKILEERHQKTMCQKELIIF